MDEVKEIARSILALIGVGSIGWLMGKPLGRKVQMNLDRLAGKIKDNRKQGKNRINRK